ncbi:MAG: YdiU family protein [Sulfuricella denitrificans]|nr:YdiU family protein [Sulfuricella denitrificans]
MKKLDQLNFENSFARLPETFHSRLRPTPLPAPYLVSFNADAAKLIDLDQGEAGRPDFAGHFIGNRLLPGSDPLAMLYAGHQFGHYVPQLGDGRAILLGEVKNRAGEGWEIQLKGAGTTPYSRSGDGRAVLRSSIREYLCSEAMHGLGIPTTRALCIVGSDQEVYRESIESAAVVTRMAPSHVRFGSFEVFYYREQKEPIAQLADYVIGRHFAHLAEAPDKYAQFLNEVVLRTARLMAQWQAVGFSHGVMNTDNMSILGLTFDYGPFGFMDSYDPAYVCNHSDHEGRYAYDQQPHIGLWNLACLAQALTPIIPVEEANAALETYESIFASHYLGLMRKKLGLETVQRDDVELISGLLDAMHASHVDYTRLFRSLGRFNSVPGETNAALRDQFIDRAAFDAWAVAYRSRLQAEQSEDAGRRQRMDAVNPKYILRNYLAQIAIRKAEQSRDFSEVDRLLELLRRPFDEQPEMESYAALPPDWAQHIEVSCSS